jgi:hypothetical protein
LVGAVFVAVVVVAGFDAVTDGDEAAARAAVADSADENGELAKALRVCIRWTVRADVEEALENSWQSPLAAAGLEAMVIVQLGQDVRESYHARNHELRLAVYGQRYGPDDDALDESIHQQWLGRALLISNYQFLDIIPLT